MNKAAPIRLDYNYMMAPYVGAARGLEPGDLEALAPAAARVHAEIQGRTGAGSDFLGFLGLPEQPSELVDRVVACADRLAALGDRHLVLGIGGSYLGARAILEALCHPFRNELSREQRNGRPRLYFEGNNMDGDAVAALMGMLPQAPGGVGEDFTINVISKSGGTIETAVAFRMFRQRLESVYGKEEAARRIVATTDVAKGSLKKLSDGAGYEQFVIPDDVGGRYSVLTPVGLLPAAIAGVDVRAMLAGARDMARRCASPELKSNPALLYAALMHLSYRRGDAVSLMAAWSKRLEFVAFWYDQLAAESLGKANGGRIPFASVNTRDLHARGQQVQEGPHNTVVTNLVLGSFDTEVKVPHDAEDADGLNYVEGWDLCRMQRAAYEGTRYAYARAGRPSVSIEIPALDAHALGQLFYMLEVATVAEGYLQAINPMDQPGVEAYKRFMFANLGRADMAASRAEFEGRRQPSEAFVL